MKTFFVIFIMVLLNPQCHTEKPTSVAQTNAVTQSKLQDSTVFYVEYQAISRGFFLNIIVDNSETTVKTDLNSKEKSFPTDEKTKSAILSILGSMDASMLPSLKAPSDKRLYDGAHSAHLQVLINGKRFSTQGFDHGNPPQEIKTLVALVLSLENPKANLATTHKDKPNGTYIVHFLNHEKVKEDDLKEVQLTIHFDGNSQVSGFNGCNHYSGSLSIENQNFSTGILKATNRFCDDKNQLENGFMDVLKRANTYQFKGEDLILLENGTILLRAMKSEF